jgi:nucleoside-diphosphate-sugar epimerase
LAHRTDRVLLTGSAGFTGRPLAERLRSDGHDVVGLARYPGEGGAVCGDLCDADWVQQVVAEIKPTVVLHLAGISATLHTDIEDYSVNVVGTANLLAALAALTERPRLVIVASSALVYGAPDTGAPISEAAPFDPRGAYAESKRATEDIAAGFRDRLPILITRPFNYTGPGQTTAFLTPKIVDHFVRRAPVIELGNLDLFRDISDVERVIEAYARMVSQPVEPAVVNICSGRTVFLRDIVSTLQDMSGHRIEVVRDPARTRVEPRTILGSTARLEAMLGPLPNPDFPATLRRMYQAGVKGLPPDRNRS